MFDTLSNNDSLCVWYKNNKILNIPGDEAALYVHLHMCNNHSIFFNLFLFQNVIVIYFYTWDYTKIHIYITLIIS